MAFFPAEFCKNQQPDLNPSHASGYGKIIQIQLNPDMQYCLKSFHFYLNVNSAGVFVLKFLLAHRTGNLKYKAINHCLSSLSNFFFSQTFSQELTVRSISRSGSSASKSTGLNSSSSGCASVLEIKLTCCGFQNTYLL